MDIILRQSEFFLLLVFLLITELRVSLVARLVEYIASAPLTSLVKPGGGIRPIDVGTIWRRLISKVGALMIGHSLNGYLDDLQFGVGV
ncbi:hypothetical protein Tco_0391687, partial [Tanacetum coccineum]